MIAWVAGWARAGMPPGVTRLARSARVRATASRVNGAAVATALLVAAAYYLRHAPLHGVVWTQWFDQSMYLRAAHAWAAGNHDPSQHWYLPGYPLLGAAFLALTPDQPFWLPDLLCLLWSVWLCGALAARLTPASRYARAGGALVFAAMVALSPLMLEVWLVPWSTTPTVPFTLAALVLALRFDQGPAPGTAGLAALVTVGIALFRPTDALVVLATVPPFMAWRLVAGWPGAARAGAIGGAALLGAALAAGMLAAAHGAVFGLAPGAYLANSAAIGFEWRRIPLQWVTLFISPQPMFATHVAGGALGGAGMMATFPWIIPGLAGMAACLAAGGSGRRRHSLVIAVVAVHIAFYLAYRDMHPDGLWRFENFHYFKGVLPLLGLYAVLLAYRLARPAGRRRALAASVVVLPLLCWRASFVRTDASSASIVGGNGIALEHGLAPFDRAVAVAAAGRWNDIYGGDTRLAVAGQADVLNNSGVKALPAAGGFVAIPLRPLPAVPGVLWVDPSVQVDASVPPVMLRARVRFGLPCLVPGWLAVCTVPRFVAGPALRAGVAVPFGGAEEPYLLEGWSGAEATGRWTEGSRAGLLLRPEGTQAGADAVLTVTAHAYLPAGGTMRVTVRGGSTSLATWVFDSDAERSLEVRVPAALLDTQGTVELQMAIERPSRSPDRRWLGLYVTSMRLR